MKCLVVVVMMAHSCSVSNVRKPKILVFVTDDVFSAVRHQIASNVEECTWVNVGKLL